MQSVLCYVLRESAPIPNDVDCVVENVFQHMKYIRQCSGVLHGVPCKLRQNATKTDGAKIYSYLPGISDIDQNTNTMHLLQT